MDQKTIPCVVLASNNVGKLKEFAAVFASVHINLIPQKDLNIPEIQETGLTFIENALLKARNAAQHSGLPALADDSGLVVDALNGAPGIYSARYARVDATDGENCDKLLRELIAIPAAERTARFYCVLVYLQNPTDPCPIICQGIWQGKILFSPQGTSGFGYDPLFYVPDYRCSAAELSLSIKNQISHRGQAIKQLLDTVTHPLSHKNGRGDKEYDF